MCNCVLHIQQFNFFFFFIHMILEGLVRIILFQLRVRWAFTHDLQF